MSTPSAFKVNVASAKLADELFKAGVPLIEQGVVVNGTRCFVFEVKPEHTRAARRILKNAFPR